MTLGLRMSSLNFIASSLFGLLALSACGSEAVSRLTSEVPCPPQSGSSCTMASRSGAQVMTISFKGQGFANAASRSAAMENWGGDLIVMGTNEEVVNGVVVDVAGNEKVQVQGQWSYEVREYQFREQKWVKCGTFNLDRCRKWQEKGIQQVNFTLQVETRARQTGEVFHSSLDGLHSGAFGAANWTNLSESMPRGTDLRHHFARPQRRGKRDGIPLRPQRDHVALLRSVSLFTGALGTRGLGSSEP